MPSKIYESVLTDLEWKFRAQKSEGIYKFRKALEYLNSLVLTSLVSPVSGSRAGVSPGLQQVGRKCSRRGKLGPWRAWALFGASAAHTDTPSPAVCSQPGHSITAPFPPQRDFQMPWCQAQQLQAHGGGVAAELLCPCCAWAATEGFWINHLCWRMGWGA